MEGNKKDRDRFFLGASREQARGNSCKLQHRKKGFYPKDKDLKS